MSKKSRKIPRRLLTATMSCVFMISLSSCSGANNSYGGLDKDGIYAKSGSYTVTNGELWDELKWDASSKLEEQIENVVLNDQINKITNVMNKSYDDLSETEKESIGSLEDYNTLKEKYSKRLADYVVQDIYNFTFSNTSYWDQIEDVAKTDQKVLKAKYIDEIFATYKIDTIGNETLADLVNNATEDNDNYLTIATNLTYVYYPQYAKELLAEEKLNEEMIEANEDDDDLDDDMLGYFSNSDYVSKFKSEYANKHDLNLVLIRFNTEEEFSDTLRAFGIKVYNKQFYYVDGIDPETNQERSYKDYCKYYDELSNTNLTYSIDSAYMLEIYIQIYNYIYEGYRTKLNSGVDLPEVTQLDNLRTEITNKILNMPADTVYENSLKALQDNLDILTYSRDSIDEISTSFVTYLYETLDLEDVNYSTATQSYNDSYYIAYKFGEGEKENDLYNKDLTDDEIVEIITSEENTELKDSLQALLLQDKITESAISSYVSEETDDVKVKIYNEATEITYSKDHSEYSKTLSNAKNKNILATIEYNKTKWNLNIYADETDEKSVTIPGSNEKYGVFNALETENGQTIAIDILSQKIIKDTDAYADTNEDRDLFNDYIEALLYNFANDGYSTSGYPSSIGKYNFLMLYFHSANIDDIIDDYYRVQYASTKLLVDYSSDSLITFLQSYTNAAYDNYFSLSGSRLVVYFDGDDNNAYDEIEDWKDNIVTFNNESVTLQEVAKSLIYEFYNEINASTDDHSTKLEALVEEYDSSARVAFDKNPIVPENQWAKYRKLGLRVKIEEFSVTNSSVDVDFNLKERLYAYADPNGEYQYFMNDTTPTIYIEPLDETCVSTENNQIVQTNDGYNLILVTTGESRPSAKWEAEDNDEDLLQNIVLKYNEQYITIQDIYNDSDKLSDNQIKLYLLEYVISSTNNLIPTDISDACSTFLSPVITRFTGDETQRQIVLEYITNASGEITWEQEGYKEILDKILIINQNSADSYNSLYEDTTGTSNSFSDWWSKLSDYLKEGK